MVVGIGAVGIADCRNWSLSIEWVWTLGAGTSQNSAVARERAERGVARAGGAGPADDGGGNTGVGRKRARVGVGERRQIMLLGIGIMIAVSLWLAGATEVKACANWCEPAVCVKADVVTGVCEEWLHFCCDSCTDPVYCGSSCGAGYYACNTASGCCAIGDGGVVPPTANVPVGSVVKTGRAVPIARGHSAMIHCPVG
jgi:hypothetical protein